MSRTDHKATDCANMSRQWQLQRTREQVPDFKNQVRWSRAEPFISRLHCDTSHLANMLTEGPIKCPWRMLFGVWNRCQFSLWDNQDCGGLCCCWGQCSWIRAAIRAIRSCQKIATRPKNQQQILNILSERFEHLYTSENGSEPTNPRKACSYY